MSALTETAAFARKAIIYSVLNQLLLFQRQNQSQLLESFPRLFFPKIEFILFPLSLRASRENRLKVQPPQKYIFFLKRIPIFSQEKTP